MHVVRLREKRKSGKIYETVLVAEAYREDGKVKKRTIANITHLSRDLQEVIAASLKGTRLIPLESMRELRSLAHGNVVAVMGMMHHLRMAQLLDRRPSRMRDIALAMIASQLLHHTSKLGDVRAWEDTTLCLMLGLENVTVDEVYGALDWLGDRQAAVEKRLAQRHLTEGGMVLYDLTSSYMERTHCPLAKFGYSRDKRKDLMQIEYGVLASKEGIPVAVDVVKGNTPDANTVKHQVEKIRNQFNINKVLLVGDRGMLTQANIEYVRKIEGIDWLTALRHLEIKKLVKDGAVQLSFWDEVGCIETTHPDFPSERLVGCYNPMQAKLDGEQREQILAALETKLQTVVASVKGGHLCGAGAIGRKIGEVTARNRIRKYLTIEYTDTTLTVTRKEDLLQEEVRLDGMYFVRTSVAQDQLSTPEVVHTYKRLVKVEHIFRTMKSIDMRVRPIRHWAEPRVKAHIFLCMLAYYVQWHMEEQWKSLLFTDEDPPVRNTPAVASQRSMSAKAKARSQRTGSGDMVHSWESLMDHLASMRRTTREIQYSDDSPLLSIDTVTEPTPIQKKALELIGVTPSDNVVSTIHTAIPSNP